MSELIPAALFPVSEEGFEAFVRQRVLNKLLDDFEWDRCHIGSGQSAIVLTLGGVDVQGLENLGVLLAIEQQRALMLGALGIVGILAEQRQIRQRREFDTAEAAIRLGLLVPKGGKIRIS